MKWVAGGLALLLIIPLAIVVLFAGGSEDCGPSGGAVDTSAMEVTNVHAIKGYNKQQMTYAAIIGKVASDEQMGKPGQIMGIMAAIQESTLGEGKGWDKPNGDHDAGLFQQRVLKGWYGSLEMVVKPEYGAKAFFKGVTAKHEGDWGTAGGGGHIPGLVDYKDKWGSSPESYGAAIQSVQVSAYPDAYTKWYADANRILEALAGTTVEAKNAPAPQAANQNAGGQSHTYNLPKVHEVPKKVADYLGNEYGIKTIGGWRESARDPEGHPSGNALDFMTNDITDGSTVGDKLAADAKLNAKNYGVDYIIWKQKIWAVGSDGWKGMEDRGGVTENHFDHVHINFKPDAKVSDLKLNGGGGDPQAGGAAEQCESNEGSFGGDPKGDASKGGVKLDNFWQFYQVDEPWRSVPYGDNLGISGCGPTTTASILTTFYPDAPTTPKTAAEYFLAHGGYISGVGSAHLWPNADIQKHFKFKTETVQPSAANARRGIQQNGLVIISVNSNTPFTSGGHIMAIRGLKGDKFLVGTSSGRGKPGGQNQNFEAFDAATFNFGSGTRSMYIITPTAKSDFQKRVVS